jgi:hypothetical protein
MRRLATVAILAVLVAACGQQESMAPEGAPAPVAESMAGGESFADQAVMGRAAPPPPPVDVIEEEAPGAPQPANNADPILYLAYSYAVGLELPSDRLSAVMDDHVQACEAAGPRLCQLIGANRSGDPESYLQGYVSLRAEPQWLARFMAGLDAQADEAGGRIQSQSRSSEDLTRQIVDTEARLEAQTTLRDRLQQLLRSRPGRLSDLLEVERELARVQAEIDSIQSNLAVMRTRVAMSELTLNYQSAPRSVGSDTFEPLRQAFAGFVGVVVSGFATIVTVIAFLLPFALVIVPIVWGLLIWRRRRRAAVSTETPRTFVATEPSAANPENPATGGDPIA